MRLVIILVSLTMLLSACGSPRLHGIDFTGEYGELLGEHGSKNTKGLKTLGLWHEENYRVSSTIMFRFD